MKYKQIPFNITLAQRISDGSVCGNLYALCNGNFYGDAKYVKSLENDRHVFKIIFPITASSTEMVFDWNGKRIMDSLIELRIKIPVENSYDEPVNNEHCNANSGIKEMQELQKELQKDGHYHKCKIEPIEYILANNLGFCEGNVVKYITRYKDKGGVDDLRKIKIYVDYLIDELTNKD